MGKLRYISKIISSLLTLKGKNIPMFAKAAGLSDQGMRNKLSKATYGVDFLIDVAVFLGIDIGFKDGDNFYSFIEIKQDHLTK